MALSVHRGAGLMMKPSSNRFSKGIVVKAIQIVFLQTSCMSSSRPRAVSIHTEPTSSIPPGCGDKTMISFDTLAGRL